MNLAQFIAKYDGKYLDYDKKYGPQCKDVFSAYNAEVVENPDYIYGDAKDLMKAADTEYYDSVSEPQTGDVVIWGDSMGPYGHVAIFVDEKKTEKTFRSFDQNYPLKTPCHIQKHNYVHIIGYLRPTNNSIIKDKEMTQEEADKRYAKKDKRINFDPSDGSYWVVDNDKRYKLGTKVDDWKILIGAQTGEHISEVEKNYPITEDRRDVL